MPNLLHGLKTLNTIRVHWLWFALYYSWLLGKGITKTLLSCRAKPCFNIEGYVGIHRKCPLSTEGGTWYPQACWLLNPKHLVHFPLEKSLSERTMQCIKDGTGGFNGCFPCRIKNCKLQHAKNWRGVLQITMTMI